MRAAMAAAEVGDDVLDGDPTVSALQDLAADWLGKQRALFVPSGTMGNQVALGSWTRPGDEIVLEAGAHIANFEGGAAGYLHGLQTRTLTGVAGALGADQVRAAIQPDNVHLPRTALLCLEQTHMGSGGRVVPLEALRAVSEVAREAGVPVHMDGARLANAVVASGIAARDWADCADSVMVCLSKGLGAPVGSLIAGDEEFIGRALRVRKRLGGWMRQAGIIAAAGKLALEENVERLADDHALARELARVVDDFAGLDAPPEDVETNLVMVRVGLDGHDAVSLARELDGRGVRVLPLGPGVLRFVTHMGVGAADVVRLGEALREVLG